MDNLGSDVCCLCLHTFNRLHSIGDLKEVLIKLLGNYSEYAIKLNLDTAMSCWECHNTLNKMFQLTQLANSSHDTLTKAIRELKLSKLPSLTTSTPILSECVTIDTARKGKKRKKIEEHVIKCEELCETKCEADKEIKCEVKIELKQDEDDIASQSDEPATSHLDDENVSLEDEVDDIASQRDEIVSQGFRIDLFRTSTKYRKLKNRYNLIILDENAMHEERMELLESFKSEPLACKQCLKMFKSAKALTEHLEVEHKSRSDYVQCDICHIFIPNKLARLTAHKRTHYVRFKCEMCSEIAETALKLHSHMSEHRTGYDVKREFRCSECRMTFVTADGCKRHPGAKIVRNVECSVCKKFFFGNHELTKHMRSHLDVEMKACSVCSRLFKGDVNLKVHMRKHQKLAETEDELPDEVYFCKECNTNFRSKHGFKHHLLYNRRHSKGQESGYHCDLCQKRFFTKLSLQDHYKSVHLNDPYVCDGCELKFTSKGALRKHRKLKHEKVERPRDHVCETCGKGFFTSELLKEHSRIHSDLRPIVCSQCQASFKSKSALYNHTRLVHENYKRNKRNKV